MKNIYMNGCLKQSLGLMFRSKKYLTGKTFIFKLKKPKGLLDVHTFFVWHTLKVEFYNQGLLEHVEIMKPFKVYIFPGVCDEVRETIYL